MISRSDDLTPELRVRLARAARRARDYERQVVSVTDVVEMLTTSLEASGVASDNLTMRQRIEWAPEVVDAIRRCVAATKPVTAFQLAEALASATMPVAERDALTSLIQAGPWIEAEPTVRHMSVSTEGQATARRRRGK